MSSPFSRLASVLEYHFVTHTVKQLVENGKCEVPLVGTIKYNKDTEEVGFVPSDVFKSKIKQLVDHYANKAEETDS